MDLKKLLTKDNLKKMLPFILVGVALGVFSLLRRGNTSQSNDQVGGEVSDLQGVLNEQEQSINNTLKAISQENAQTLNNQKQYFQNEIENLQERFEGENYLLSKQVSQLTDENKLLNENLKNTTSALTYKIGEVVSNANGIYDKVSQMQTEKQQPVSTTRKDIVAPSNTKVLPIIQLQDGSNKLPNSFDEQAYLRANPDVARAVQNGEIQSGSAHYQIQGFREGRSLN